MTNSLTETTPEQKPAVNSGFAVTAMVLGIVSIFLAWLFCITSILAIIFAGVDMKKASDEGRKPSGMAITGLVLGIIFTAFYGLILIAGAAA